MNFTSIILVRHGQTEWNRVERFRGRIDLELNETGIEQAEAAARRLTQVEVEAIYASPLRRAFTTASIIAKASDLVTQTLPELIDIDYGLWQGLTPQEVAGKYPELYRLWLQTPSIVQMPEGENLTQVRQRAWAALNQTLERHRGQTVVLVSHHMVCKVLLGTVLGLDLGYVGRIRQDTCAINIIEEGNSTLAVTLLNDTCHLQKT
ncbi:MAG: histidine phosphatase family protein [Chloroflexi bacterium]|nr:histidine phosphatase family protein [Chloroflexota bacterium]